MKRTARTQKLNIFLMIVSLFMVGLTTYAWFTMTTSAYVDSLDTNVTEATDVDLNVDLDSSSGLTAYYGPGDIIQLAISLKNEKETEDITSVSIQTVKISNVLADNAYIKLVLWDPNEDSSLEAAERTIIQEYTLTNTGVYDGENNCINNGVTQEYYEGTKGNVYVYQNVYIIKNYQLPAQTELKMMWGILVSEDCGLEIVGSVIDLDTYDVITGEEV